MQRYVFINEKYQPENPEDLCEPSQNGLSELIPQRHRKIGLCRVMISPLELNSSKSPETCKGPFLNTLNSAFLSSISIIFFNETDLTVRSVTIGHTLGSAATAERGHQH